MIEDAADYPGPPAAWDSLSHAWPNDELDRQWEHYRPLFEKYGYSLRDLKSDSSPVPQQPSLSTPRDVFSPQSHELFCPRPIRAGPPTPLLLHYHVRVGYDAAFREVYFKALFDSELDVTLYLFRQQQGGRDPRDHTIPFMKIIQTPSCTFAITPKWGSISVPFYTLQEPIDFLKQCAEGLAYMHEHRIAHRDISATNIVMSFDGEDTYDPDGVKPFRSLFDVQYAFVDFGLSSRFDRSTPLDDARVTGSAGTDPFRAPELITRTPYNPFRSDVYSLGALVSDELRISELHESQAQRQLQRHAPDFLPLLARMTDVDPSRRPSAEEVQEEVAGIHERVKGIAIRSGMKFKLCFCQ